MVEQSLADDLNVLRKRLQEAKENILPYKVEKLIERLDNLDKELQEYKREQQKVNIHLLRAIQYMVGLPVYPLPDETNT